LADRIAVTGPLHLAVPAAAAIARALHLAGTAVQAWCSQPGQTDGHAAEFVFAEGRLGRSDLSLLEWATGRELSWDAPAGTAPLVVAGACADAKLVLDAAEVPVRRDAYARPFLAGPMRDLPRLAALPTPPMRQGGKLLVIVGAAGQLRDIYPAVLLRLAEVLDQPGNAAITPHLAFLPGAEVARNGLPAATAGVLLPGGARMEEVMGQLRAADEAHARNLPTLGLCLGMQCMATAAMRRGGAHAAMLEEVSGPGAQCSFLRHPKGAAPHRLGAHAVMPQPDSRLAALIDTTAWSVRMNHRFRLNVALLPAMQKGGLEPVAWSHDGVCEAIERRGSGFGFGVQGHPELGLATPDQALFAAFLRAVAG
jgi:imidazoleglycerol phosphate synthase glutamine amidotransferase subunit HisH